MTPSRREAPLFLQRQTYRQRRVRDAARALPVLGLVLWMVPLLWMASDSRPGGSETLLYLFGVWFGLVVAAFWLIRAMDRTDDAAKDAQRPGEPATSEDPAP